MKKVHLHLPYSTWSLYQYAWCMYRFKGTPVWDDMPRNGTQNPEEVTCKQCTRLYAAASQDSKHPLAGFMRMQKFKNKITSSDQMAHVFRKLAFENKQIIHCLVLNKDFQAIHESTVFTGTAYDILWQPREIFKPIVLNNGYAFALGISKPFEHLIIPSKEDKKMALQLVKASVLMQIQLLDIILVSSFGYVSIQAMTDIWETHQVPDRQNTPQG